MNVLITYREQAQSVLNTDDIIGDIGNSDYYSTTQELTKELHEGMEINNEFDTKLSEDLDKLQALSGSRKPLEDTKPSEEEEEEDE